MLGGAALFVGLTSGAGVWLFKRLIDLAHLAAFDGLGAGLSHLGGWTVMLVPVVGGLVVGSAFLASGVEGQADGTSALNAGRAKLAWPGVDPLLQAALSRIEQPASGGHLPASFGLREGAGWSQSRSPVIAGVNAVEAQEVVPFVSSFDEMGELEKDSGISRTHCL